MQADKIQKFMTLAGQMYKSKIDLSDEKKRELGAQLLLSEVLEYCIKGLGLELKIGEQVISDPESIKYKSKNDPDPKESLDGLADVAYTMYWNMLAFGLPLESAFDLVCDNNLEKFVKLDNWTGGQSDLETSEWACGKNVEWPSSVVKVSVIKVENDFYAVGKDLSGKVRKPSTYVSVDLEPLLVG